MIPVNLVSTRASFLYCTRGCGCIEHPAFPAPSSIEGAKELKEFLQTSGAWRREIAEVCLAPSLRANGSGERPPADRLREAIQNLSTARFWIASAYAKSASADSKPAIARESDGGSSQALLGRK